MMIGKKVIDTEPITISEAREILMNKVEEKADENNEVDGHQFTYEQNLTIDYVNKFAFLDAEDAKKLKKELEEYVTPIQAVKIVDIMPEDLADLRLIFAKERGVQEKETLEKILDLIDQYR
jgi:DNA-directed RNA polymerase subunit F